MSYLTRRCRALFSVCSGRRCAGNVSTNSPSFEGAWAQPQELLCSTPLARWSNPPSRNPPPAVPHPRIRSQLWPTDLAGLQGARLVIGAETPSQRKLDSVVVKSLTGDEEFTARPIYREEVTFPVTFIVVMVTNPLPRADEADTAMWDRLVLVPSTSDSQV